MASADVSRHPASAWPRPYSAAIVRTPNGNDYGKDLLRQHYEKHKHGQ